MFHTLLVFFHLTFLGLSLPLYPPIRLPADKPTTHLPTHPPTHTRPSHPQPTSNSQDVSAAMAAGVNDLIKMASAAATGIDVILGPVKEEEEDVERLIDSQARVSAPPAKPRTVGFAALQ